MDHHKSDCATHNQPALPNGPCDCGADILKIGNIVRITFTDGQYQEGPVMRRVITEYYNPSGYEDNIRVSHHVLHPGGTSAALEDYLVGPVKVELMVTGPDKS